MPAVDRTINKVKDPAFAQRLEDAADLHPHSPPKHSGRLDWVREELQKKGLFVSNETVRKWFSGEARPRPDKGKLLAQVFGVDAGYLLVGADADLTPRERKARNATVDGAVNVVAGFIAMDGGTVAFPDADDKKALRQGVDLTAIIKGANYAFNISVGMTLGSDIRFTVPGRHDDVIVLGVVREEFAVDIFELTPEIISEYGKSRGGSIDVVVSEAKLKKIESFTQRL